MWDYQVDEIYTYKELQNVIVNLHITLPKNGVFSSEVSYIMIVATITEIYLILIVQDGDSHRLTFLKSDFVYDVPYVVTSICSTSERRVFLGSQNNYLYELDYTNTFSFFGFSKKAKKITHSSQSFFEKLVPNVFNFKKYSYMTKMVVDNTRHLLYALIYYTKTESSIFNSENVCDSVIYIYDLGEDGTDFQKLGEINQSVIKERFIFSVAQSNPRKDSSFVILDIYPITRMESKYYNLVIVTKNGIRAYISFDTFYSNKVIKDEEKLNEMDKNKIYRIRPSMKYSIILKQIPEPSNATILEGIETDNTLRALQKYFIYNQIYFLDQRFFIFYKDEFKKRSFVDVIEMDESSSVKLQDQINISLSLFRNKEILSNILKFDVNKELYSMLKLPYNTRGSLIYEFGLSSLLKLIEQDNIIPRNINYMDSNEHLSFSCMHIFAKQLFLPPEEIVVMTSSELVIISKLRPIDNLFRIIMTSDHESTQIPNELHNFINEYGISETSFMLFTIMSNRNYVFYRKFEESMHNESLSQDNLVNVSNILMMDSTEMKNNQKTIDIATSYFIRLIEYTIRGINIGDKKIEKPRSDGVKHTLDNNYIGQAAVESHAHRMNFISYALYMYLARIGRVFWEENIYIYNKSPQENESFLTEAIKIHQLKYLISLIMEYQNKLRETQSKILHKASEVDIKVRTFSMDPKNEAVNVNFSDFSNLPNEYEEVLYLSEKYIETLSLVEILYELNSLKKHLLRQSPNTLKEMTALKFKDIILNTNMPMIKLWIEEYFEVALNENDFTSVGNKLDELAQVCPNIVSQNEKDQITANMLIRLSKSKANDEISKKNMISKAVGMMNRNPENVKLEKTVKILGELGEVRAIVELCVKKAIVLKAKLEKEGERNLSLLNLENTSSNLNVGSKKTFSLAMTQSDKEICFNEYKQCLYTILKLLNEIHIAIKNHERDYTSTAPDHIKAVLANKKLTLEEKLAMHTAVIEEILKYDNKFLHDLLFDHLKSQDMLEDIVKYDSPYIEPYLSAQIEKERSNPKRYEALYKFYLNSKNFQGALRILLQLINFDNSNLDYQENFVKLEDRRNYVKHLLYTLDYLIENEKDEEAKNYYIKIKHQHINLRDSYLIQHDILLALQNIFERIYNTGNKNAEEAVREAIFSLDRNYYDMMDLYLLFAKKFRLYEVNFQIFFEMFNKNLEIDEGEVKENYENYFSQTIKRENVKWPQSMIILMNKLFVNLVETKSTYDSFSTMLRDNNYKNIFNSILPLDYLVLKIEKINWVYLIKEKEVDFESKSNSKYDSNDNFFWFVSYLKDVVKLPCFYLFKIYNSLLDSSSDEDQSIVLTIDLIQIIRMWCNNVEILIDRTDKKDSRIPRHIYDDYSEFIKSYSYLQTFLKKIYENYNKKTSFKIVLDDESRRKIVSFCQSVENKLEYVVNYYIKMSKKSHEPINMNLIAKEKESEKEKEWEKKKSQEDIFSLKKQPYVIKSNILDQCD